MKNSEYWSSRFEQIEANANKSGIDTLKDLESMFDKAQRETQNQIDVWYARLANNNGVSIIEARKLLTANELKEFKWDVKEYIKYGKENAINQNFIKELENASVKFHISRLEAIKIQTRQVAEKAFATELSKVGDMAESVYKDGYYRSIYEIQKGFNVGFDVTKIDDKKLQKLLIKPWASDGKNFSDRIWQSKATMVNELHTELTRMCIMGKPPDEAIKHLSQFVDKKFKNAKARASALVMTEQAYFSSVSQKDCFNDLDVEKFQVLSTLDNKTSEICRAMDGKVFPMSEFLEGTTAPPFHVKCRSITIPYFNDEFTVGEMRAARGEDGKTYYVPSDMTYEEWKKGFIDGDKSGIIKETEVFKPFEPAKSLKEAEDYARTTLGIKNVSYKGVDIITANEWNRGLRDSFNRFPELKNYFSFVGEAHERNTMLEGVLKQVYLDELIIANPKHTPIQLEPYADERLKNFMKSMKVSKQTFAQSWAPNVEPYAQFKGITVNRDWGKNSDKFIEELIKNAEVKFHPVGCDTIRSVLDHEIGHQLDGMLGIGDLKEIQKLFDGASNEQLTDALSRYAWDNKNANRYSEMIAEGWAEYCNNPKPRNVAKIIGETIENKYREKFR